MKKYLFTTLFLLGMALTAVAQKRVWYDAYQDKEHKNYYTHYIMDRKNMEFHFDWDGDNEMVIKNYKKNGNTETFDCYYKEEPKKLFARVTLTLDTTPTHGKITVIHVENKSPKEVFYICENNKEMSRLQGNDEPGIGQGGGNSVTNGGNSVTNGAKKLLNKGKNLFKKKDK